MFRVEGIGGDDTRQWLHQTWGFTRVKSEDEPVLTHFVEVGYPNSRIRKYTQWDKYEETSEPLSAIEVYCHWPMLGAVNVPLPSGDVGVVLTRRIEKHYRRSCCPTMLSLEIPKLWQVTKKHGPAVTEIRPAFSAVMWAAFFPKYPTVREAMERIQTKQAVCLAISPHILLVGDGKTTLIYDKMKAVGRVEDGQVIMTYDDAMVIRRIQKHLTMKLEGTL